MPNQNAPNPPSPSHFSPPANMSHYLHDEFVQDEDYHLPPPPLIAQETQSPQIPFTRSRAKLMKKIAPIFSLPLSERLNHAKTSGQSRLILSRQKQRSLVETCNQVAAQIMDIQQKKNSPPPTYSSSNNKLENVYTRDNFGLPHPPSHGQEDPAIIKRRNYLKKLSVQDRNLLLTGDPYFQFDPIVYDCCFWLPKKVIPPVLLNQLHYLIPENIDVSDSDEFESFEPTEHSSSESSSSDSEEIISSPESDHATDFPEPVNNEKKISDTTRSQPCSPVVKNLEKSPRAYTRSGLPFARPKTPPASASGSSSSSVSKFLSKAGRVAGKLMDSHPLATPKPSTSKRKKK